MKYDIHETYDGGGNLIEKIEIPWTKERYQAELYSLDAQLTPRRIIEALNPETKEAGEAWFAALEQEKRLLRDEMAALYTVDISELPQLPRPPVVEEPISVVPVVEEPVEITPVQDDSLPSELPPPIID